MSWRESRDHQGLSDFPKEHMGKVTPKSLREMCLPGIPFTAPGAGRLFLRQYLMNACGIERIQLGCASFPVRRLILETQRSILQPGNAIRMAPPLARREVALATAQPLPTRRERDQSTPTPPVPGPGDTREHLFSGSPWLLGCLCFRKDRIVPLR